VLRFFCTCRVRARGVLCPWILAGLLEESLMGLKFLDEVILRVGF
jgi:hypothetical protein